MNQRKIVVTAQDRPVDIARRGLVAVVNLTEHIVPDGDHGAVRERILANLSTCIDRLIAGEVDNVEITRSEGWSGTRR